jgi:C4-dicarboxylate-specific signal transduction histidine kinase
VNASTHSSKETLHEDLKFFGSISASVSHEMNNVFSIVEQVNGLLEDQLYAAQSGAELDDEKLTSIQERIEKQIGRGVEIVHHLNRFAHSVDDRDSAWDVNDLLATIQVLYGRFADLKTLTLIVEPSPQTVLVDKDMFHTLQLLFYTLRSILDSEIHEKNTLLLGVSTQNDRAVFTFRNIPVSAKTVESINRHPAVAGLTQLLEAEIDVINPGTEDSALSVSVPALIVADGF